jgi:dienelactone hydrolase
MLDRRMFLGALATGALTAEKPKYGSMMWDYITSSIARLDEQRAARLAAIGSVTELRELQRTVRQRVAEMWGPLPAGRTPLNARSAGVVEASGHTIEKVIFESRPAFYVTANVYRPRSVSGRLPAVLFSPGHTDNGKCSETYRRLCTLLARNGFVVLTWDPVGQGERLQLYDAARGRSLAGPGTREHSALGRQCYLLGINLMQYRAWDATRGIDYLISRGDVDPERMGFAGHSGGGMETLQFVAWERRLKAAAPVCAVTSFRHKTEGLLIADPEQNLSGTLAYGIDHPELLAAFAPNALLIGAAIRDYVPIAGVRRTYRELQHVYRLLGVPDKLGLAETDDKHVLNRELREALASWFVRWLAGEERKIVEEETDLPDERELWCTKTGQVATSLGGETILSLNQKLAREIAPAARPADVVHAARRITRVDTNVPESGIVVPVREFRDPQSKRTVLLASEAPATEIAGALASAGCRVIAVDVRGWGETKPEMPDRKASFAWDDFFAFRSLELGRPLFGQRLRDLLTAAPQDCIGVGIGAGALLVAHAAALDRRFRAVALVRPLISYRSLIDDPLAQQPFSSYLPGVLSAYEVRDLLAAIAPRKVLVIDPEDSRGRPASEASVREEFRGGITVKMRVDAGSTIAAWAGTV